MSTKRSPIKFSLGKLLSQLKINNNNIDDIPSDKEIISLVPNVLMIPYDVLNINGSNDHGTLCLIKCKKVDRNHLSFYISMDKEPEWDIILDRYSQITRPRPNLLSVFSYGTTTLFKCDDPIEAKTLYDTIESTQGNVKVINRNNNYEQLGNFHQLDFTSWANHVMSSSVNKNTVDSTDLKPLSSTNESKKSKTLKQTKVTNSFKTIVNAAKRVKKKKTENHDCNKKDVIEIEDDTSPLLL